MATDPQIEASKERWKRGDYLGVDGDFFRGRDAAVLADAFVSQRQPVNERLLKAAKELIADTENIDVGSHETLAEFREAITAAEAEIEERRKPVTEDWLKNQPGWESKQPSLVPQYLHKELYAQVNFWPKTGPILLFGGTQINDPQRWHVLDLMRVIGGAT